MSIAEAEYRAAATIAQEYPWLRQLLMICIDQLATQWSYIAIISQQFLGRNPAFHARTKHVEVHYHFIWKMALQGKIKIKDQVRDIFTKGHDIIAQSLKY